MSALQHEKPAKMPAQRMQGFRKTGNEDTGNLKTRKRDKKVQGAPPASPASVPQTSVSPLPACGGAVLPDIPFCGKAGGRSQTTYHSLDATEHLLIMLAAGGAFRAHKTSPLTKLSATALSAIGELFCKTSFRAADPAGYPTDADAHENAANFVNNWSRLFGLIRWGGEPPSSLFHSLLTINDRYNRCLFPAGCLRSPVALLHALVEAPAIPMPTMVRIEDGLDAVLDYKNLKPAEPMAWVFQMALRYLDRFADGISDRTVYFNPSGCPHPEMSTAATPYALLTVATLAMLSNRTLFGRVPLSENQCQLLRTALSQPGYAAEYFERVMIEDTPLDTAWLESPTAEHYRYKFVNQLKNSLKRVGCDVERLTVANSPAWVVILCKKIQPATKEMDECYQGFRADFRDERESLVLNHHFNGLADRVRVHERCIKARGELQYSSSCVKMAVPSYMYENESQYCLKGFATLKSWTRCVIPAHPSKVLMKCWGENLLNAAQEDQAIRIVVEKARPGRIKLVEDFVRDHNSKLLTPSRIDLTERLLNL